MLRGKSRKAVGVAVAGLVLLTPALVIGYPAAAQPDKGTSATRTTVPAPVFDGKRSGISTNRDGAKGYWTADRMRRAIPVTTVAGAGAAASTIGGPTGPAGSIPPVAARNPIARPKAAENANKAGPKVVASPAAGKVFFRNAQNGLDYVCSANTLASNSRKLVLTAGHCIHGGRGGTWHQNWVFVPLYNYGAQPYGSFAAKYYTTFQAWVDNSDFSRDVAFVTMWENAAGVRVVDAVGGNGISWNYPYEQYITILAYPAAPPYDGGWQQACTGTTSRQDFAIRLKCGFTGGSSGSSWLREYSDSSGLGSANGAMSTIDTAGWNASSYFDTAVRDLYLAMADRT